MPPLAIMGGIMAASGVASAAIGANAAGNAADAQANAAIQAAQIQANQANKALDFSKQQYATGQAELAPWLSSGAGALANLSNLLGIPVSGNATIPGAAPTTAQPMSGVQSRPGFGVAGTMMPGGGGSMRPGYRSPMMGGGRADIEGAAFRPTTGQSQPLAPTHTVDMKSLINPALGASGSLLAPFKFDPNQDPGYKFRLQQGMQALERSSAARGGLLSGGTLKDITNYSQDAASNEYMNSYNRYQNDQTTKYNRLAAMAGVGQQTASQLGTMGQNASNTIGNILMTSGQQQGNAINDAAQARASGYLNSAGAWGGAINGIGNSISQFLLMKQLFPQAPASVPYGQYQPQPYLGIGS